MSEERLPRVTLTLDANEFAEISPRYRRQRRTLTTNMDRASYLAAEAAQEAVMRALRSDKGEATLTIRVTRVAKKPPAWAQDPAAS